MSYINQVVMNTLLNATNSRSLNNRNSLNDTSDNFNKVLSNTLGGLVLSSNTCSSCNNNSSLNIMDTLLGSINYNKLNSNQMVNIQNSFDDDKITNNKMDQAIKLLNEQLGKKYVWGSTGPDSFDCSGLVQYVYKEALGKDIPRVSYEQGEFGKVIDRKDLKVGDLVFFDTMKKDRISHVGMYIGNNEFIHASNPKEGVKKSTLAGFYEKTYKGARRP
ncbi:MAG: C40 family peptidase [Peptostreptococcaceae bacterium]